MPSQLCSFFRLWAILLFLLPETDAYASWLRCYVELDESEVVMHHPMVPQGKTHYNVLVEVQEGDQWIVGDQYRLPTTSPEDSEQMLQIRLRVPEALSAREVQSVLEIQSLSKNEDDELGAIFVGKGAMCEGIRSSTPHQNMPVTLNVSDLKSPVTLVAAYAPGYEAVSLSRPMVILPSGAEGSEL